MKHCDKNTFKIGNVMFIFQKFRKKFQKRKVYMNTEKLRNSFQIKRGLFIGQLFFLLLHQKLFGIIII